MYYLAKKDAKYKKKYFEFELKILRNKAVLHNRNLSKFTRLSLLRGTKLFQIVKHSKNRCIFSKRKYAMTGPFNLSQSTFREQVLAGNISGLLKASW